MLVDIITGHATSSCVVVEDNVEQAGAVLLQAFLSSLANRVELVQLVLYELSEEDFVGSLPPNVIKKLKVTNIARDPLSWEDSPSTISMSTDICCHLLEERKHMQHNITVAVVMDSLSNLILSTSAAYVSRVLHRLGSNSEDTLGVTQTVALVHSDLHNDTTLKLLHHTASTVVTLSPAHRSEDYYAGCQVTHKTVSGKVIKWTGHFNIDRNLQIKQLEKRQITTAPKSTEHTIAPDPAANLTFNLTLSEQEKMARSQMTLPFMHDQERQERELKTSTQGAQVFYELDQADDFDEDDPDDDLDI
ncbi:hypothetical protein LSAT2_011586 [Lamellibrachia satsuma]|nr:hypothetical protein LSAT2_011586 [Lamellibrachia satsuma]